MVYFLLAVKKYINTLLKIGFEAKAENKDSGYQELILKVNGFIFLAAFECDKLDAIYIKGSAVAAIYLHELQNIYYFLNPSEGELKGLDLYKISGHD